jgi:TrmH family RNA methyltransferase
MLEDLSGLRDHRVIAADLGGQDVASVRLETPYILAVGNEARGISPELRPWIVQTITIPLRNSSVNSLNAAVAAGIVMYELNGKTGPQDAPGGAPA